MWQHGLMTAFLRNRHHWIFGLVALAVWLAIGWPFVHELVTGIQRRALPMPPLWLAPFALFGAAVFGSVLLRMRGRLQWPLLCVQLAAVLAMATILRSDTMSVFLIVIAWQVATATTAGRALAWVLFQTAAIIAVLAQGARPDLSYILVLSIVLQLSFVLTAHALRRESGAARALAEANAKLEAAQALIAHNVRDAERLRISRELHDAWGHELTALGLQLELASRVPEPERANDHVIQAKGLSRALLAKVRDAVAALRNSERSDLKAAAVAGGEDARLPARRSSGAGSVAGQLRWIFCIVALAVWLALGIPVYLAFELGFPIRGVLVSPLWFVPFSLLGAAIFAAMALRLRPRLHWTLLSVQLASVAAMAIIVPWAGMTPFLIIIAWQVALAAGFVTALGWACFQTLVVIGALALAPEPDLCWVIGKSFALQLFMVFSAQALRREAETARALAQTNRELQAAQAIIASTARDAERLRISRELHDAWGHELTALGLQLEIASHVAERARADDHVMQARGLAGTLLGKVRDVVATLQEAERCDLQDSLEALARSVPTPAIHVQISPDLRVRPDQAHALMRCAQEAVTNAVKHAEAANLWLEVTCDGDGVRLVARNDGSARRTASAPGSGLVGMRERVESLGGRLAVQAGGRPGFTIDAWLPSRTPRTA